MIRNRMIPASALFACLMVMAALVFAQTGGALSYGAAVVGRLDGASASIVYSFEGSAGDRAWVRLLGMAPGLRPSLTLIAPSQQEVAASGTAGPDAEMTAVLPETGTYGILVSGGGAGEFLLQLTRRDLAVQAEALVPDEPRVIDLAASGEIVRLTFTSESDCQASLSVLNVSANGAGFAGRVLDASGHDLARYSASASLLTLPAGAGTVLIELAAQGTQTARVQVMATCEAESRGLIDVSGLPGTPPQSTPQTGFMMVSDGGPISYGQGVLAQMIPGAPMLSYRFAGQAGDLVRADLIAFTPGLDPVLYLISPDGQPLAFSDNLPFSLTPGDAGITFALPDSGTYALVAGQTNGTSGGYVLRLAGGPPAPAAPIPANVPIPIDDGAFMGTQRLSYLLAARDCPANVTLAAAGADAVPMDARLLGPSGEAIAQVSGSVVRWVTGLAQGDSVYRFEAGQAGPSSAYTLTVSCASPDAPAQPAVTAMPETTAAPDAAAEDVSGTCTITAPNNINIRSGPGTQYTVLGVVLAGTTRDVIGVSADGQWYVLPEDDILGLVSARVVTASGACDTLPVNEGYLNTQRIAPTPAPATSIPVPTNLPNGQPPQNPNPGNQPTSPPPPPGSTSAPPTQPGPTSTPGFATQPPTAFVPTETPWWEPTPDCGPVACIAALPTGTHG
jgi:uncharacterized protein YraI